MSTDTGHNSSTIDGSWAYHQPDKMENWGHLAMHGSVAVAQRITAGFYGKDISYKYYAGCSTGGRQGLKEAELYPEDFDGIIAGAPAWWTTHLQPWTVQVELLNLPTTADYHIPPSLFPVIAKEVVKQCDPQDGVTDSIISDPSDCNFRAEELLCSSNVTNSTASNCLTSAQLTTLSKIHSDYIGPNQTFYFPHLSLGSESLYFYFTANAPSPLGTDFVKYFLGLGKDWSIYDFSDDVQKLADKTNPGNANVGFDLSKFEKKGGKILGYHGMSDGGIPTESTTYYYNQVYRNLKPSGIDIDAFYRLFLVPGMSHCAGTTPLMNAPWYFAGPNQAQSLGPTVHGVPGFEDAEHDVLRALMGWVEQGKEPEYVVGTKYVDDTRHDEVVR